MNFTVYFEAENSGHVAFMFNFIDGRLNWGSRSGGIKRTDSEGISELLREAQDSGLPSRVAIAD